MVQWDDKYSTGVEHLDDQHKKLFDYINTLERAVGGGDANPQLLMDMLEYFEHYAKSHFGDEEECMHRYHCPIAKNNQQAHQRFIGYFDHLKQEIKRDGYDEQVFSEVLKFTEDWIVQHICVIDTQLKPCVHQ